MSEPVDVAVAVLLRPDGRVLLAQRPHGKVYADYWEFPGGKVEPGESVRAALARELVEELGIEVRSAFPWINQVFTYPHATVRLHFFRVFAWRGEPRAVEHQGLSWEAPGTIGVAPLLPANGPVLKSLLLPDEYAITQLEGTSADAFLTRLQERLAAGLRLVQIREKKLPAAALESFSRQVLGLVHAHGGKVLVNGDADLARRIGADGVHLTAAQLAVTSARPDFPWCAASCHSVSELRTAERLGLDFAVLGPVLPTPSHPEQLPLGWSALETILAGARLPVYALGGMTHGLLEKARQCGAQGVAMIRGSWDA